MTPTRKQKRLWKQKAKIIRQERELDRRRVLQGEDPDKVAWERAQSRKERGWPVLAWLDGVLGTEHPIPMVEGHEVTPDRRMRSPEAARRSYHSDSHFARLSARHARTGP